MTTIRFMKHYVTNGQHKCRVWYSLDNHVSRKPCVTLYAKCVLESLTPIFGAATQNDSDMRTDYFEKDRVRFFEDNPLYAAAREAAMRNRRGEAVTA